MSSLAAFTAVALLAQTLSPEASAQAQINTKKVKIGDFTQNVLKVVVTGNPLFDNLLQGEMSSMWRISPYEFCSLDEFNADCGNPDYYFMLLSKTRFSRETAPGIEFLTVVKGGKEAEKGIGGMLEVCSFPVRAAQMPSGREFDFIPAILDIIQDYILKSMSDDRTGYSGFGKFACGISATSGMNVVVAGSDVAGNVPAAARSKAADAGVVFVDDDEADEIMSSGDMNSVVSYTVAPSSPAYGSYCYKMLIGAGDHRLYYFRRQRVRNEDDCGFKASELNRIGAVRGK